MIPFQEILKLAKGFPAEIVEKDYCLTWLLEGLSQSPLSKQLIFYGGTALKKIYFPDFRFSEDLDFLSEKNLKKNDILKVFDSIYNDLRQRININFFTQDESVTLKGDRLQFMVGYDGFPEISFAKQLKLDIHLNQALLEKGSANRILSPYSDKREIRGKLPSYSLEAITAEKLSAIFDLTRKEPRDLYDLGYLLKQPRLNRKKTMRLLQKKYGFVPPLTALLANIRSAVYPQRWEMRLKSQVVKLGAFNPAISDLEKRIKKLYTYPP